MKIQPGSNSVCNMYIVTWGLHKEIYIPWIHYDTIECKYYYALFLCRLLLDDILKTSKGTKGHWYLIAQKPCDLCLFHLNSIILSCVSLCVNPNKKDPKFMSVLTMSIIRILAWLIHRSASFQDQSDALPGCIPPQKCQCDILL